MSANDDDQRERGGIAGAEELPPLLAIGLFVLANLILPPLFGDLYPFSSSPMFRDRPAAYCTYMVFGPDGVELPPADFGLHRNYDGNPDCVGVGRRPAPSLDRFGLVTGEAEVRAHVAKVLAGRPELAFVEVVQEVVGPVDSERVGVVTVHRWRVGRGGGP